MADLEKAEDGIREPEHSHKSASKYNTKERDLEATLPQSQSILGQTYGVGPGDGPLQPPRHVRSKRSLRRPESVTSLRSASYVEQNNPPSIEGGNDDAASVADELAWGPSHPCFPHLNCHVPINSEEYKTTRIIRIRRDWMVKGDLAPTYSNIYPEILDHLLPESEFRFIIEHINKTLIEAFDPYSKWNWVDGLLGLATGWLWEDFRPGGVKKSLRSLETWIEQWNLRVGARNQVMITPLRRTGYMNLDIQIPDPQIRLVDKDESRPETRDG